MFQNCRGNAGRNGSQQNKLEGGARPSGSITAAEAPPFSLRWSSILLITTGSSIHAMTLTEPPHSRQVLMSILKTRFKRWAQVMDARRSAGLWSSRSLAESHFLPLPRLDGVISARYLLFEANTP